MGSPGSSTRLLPLAPRCRSTASRSAASASPTSSSTSQPGSSRHVRDPGGRPTVAGLVDHPSRVVPVGRLDAETTGALLLTNDGELAHRLAHPRYGVDKVYEAQVRGEPTRQRLAALAAGVELEDGMTAPAVARRLAANRVEVERARGPQPSGAADARSRWAPGRLARAHELRRADARRPCSRSLARAQRVRARVAARRPARSQPRARDATLRRDRAGRAKPIRSYIDSSVTAATEAAFSAPSSSSRESSPGSPRSAQ